MYNHSKRQPTTRRPQTPAEPGLLTVLFETWLKMSVVAYIFETDDSNWVLRHTFLKLIQIECCDIHFWNWFKLSVVTYIFENDDSKWTLWHTCLKLVVENECYNIHMLKLIIENGCCDIHFWQLWLKMSVVAYIFETDDWKWVFTYINYFNLMIENECCDIHFWKRWLKMGVVTIHFETNDSKCVLNVIA